SNRNGTAAPSGLAEGEVERLAAAAGAEPEAFRERYVRTVADPRTGELRAALREEVDADGRGRCVFLEGANHCRLYAARPSHCASFPFWPSVLESRAGFERARETCPGLEPADDGVDREPAFAEMERLYAELDRVVERSHSVCLARGLCCRFEEAGHELFATGLEADYAAARHPKAPEPEAEGRCPHHVAGKCSAREGRPLGCRTYFCDPQTEDAMTAVHEEFLGRIRAIERRHGIPRTYGRFPAQLAARGVGRPVEETGG
ncbi:MAG: YkgJ family cysteine cluster protein, partial [Planctomycetota bacterium]